jgi:hypothetical protein
MGGHLPDLDGLRAGRRRTAWVGEPLPGHRLVAVPGSFDPLHEGHLGLARAAVAAAEQSGLGPRSAAFELSVDNVDKPRLDLDEVRRRVAALRAHGPVVVTAAARFLDKARLLPGAVFAVGHDTAARIVDPAYYDDVPSRDAALAELASLGCRVAVAGRALRGAAYRDLGDLDVPAGHGGLFLAVPDFRIDQSSTELRRQEPS